ncbi:MAG: glycosyltransferase family 39 protein [Bryobacterales bacterium]|nr:glycosyltransferase family 39 protein [Bryobacterales bacterium]
MNRLVPYLICLFFLIQCIVFIPLLGPQHDEVLFAGILLNPLEYTHKIDFAGFEIFTMLDFYLGALKGWLYAPLVRLLDTNLYTLRLPVALLGAVTISLVYWLLSQTVGRRPALISAALLSADPIYILTTTFDWGPCVLQRLFLTGILASAVAYYRRPRLLFAAIAGFAAGLAVWDKLSFVWMLAGCGIAALAIFHRELRKSLRPAPCAAFLACAFIGAFPALHANWGALGSARERTAALTESTLPIKAWRLWLTLDGSALYRFFTNTPNGPAHLGAWLTVLLLAALPIWWKAPYRRAVLFTALAFLFSAAAMFATNGGAAGAHHTALLWPLPSMLLGLLIAGVNRRAVETALMAVVLASALRVTYSYRAEILNSGSAIAWTEASLDLARYLEDANLRAVFTHDWGISSPLRYLGDNRFPITDTSGWFLNSLRRHIPNHSSVFVFHPSARQLHPNIREKVDQLAAELNAVPRTIRTLYDRRGRPAFKIVRYVPR